MPLKLIAIAGVAKCGTSSLYDYLVQHPQIAKAKKKEINYFSHSYGPWKQYLNLINFNVLNHQQGKWFIDGTSKFERQPETLRRLKIKVPQAQLIILLRHPIDRMFSNYKMNSYQIPKLRQNDFDTYARRGIANVICQYYTNVQRLLQKYPPNQVQIFQSELFFDNPRIICNQIFKHINLPSHRVADIKANVPVSQGIRYAKSKEIEPETRIWLIEHFQPMVERLNKLLQLHGYTPMNWDLSSGRY